MMNFFRKFPQLNCIVTGLMGRDCCFGCFIAIASLSLDIYWHSSNGMALAYSMVW